MKTFITNITPEQRLEMQEKARISKEQKKELYKNIRTDYADMKYWEELASKHGVRLPVRYYPATDVKYVNRMAKKLNINIKEYVESTGCKSLREYANMNPNWSAAAMCGLFLEYVEDTQ